MADNEQYNDEYQFADLDTVNPDGVDDSGLGGDASKLHDLPSSSNATQKIDTKRKAMLVIGLVVTIMIIYKLIGIGSSGKKEVVNAPAITPVAKTIVNPTVTPSIPSQTATSQLTNELNAVDTKVGQKLAALATTQQSMRSDVSAVNDQIGGIGKNMEAIAAKLTELNGIIVNLNNKVEEQSKQIEHLTVQRLEAKRAHHEVHRLHTQQLKYHIQAVIPGRAWLIASNGTTLTVREGTHITGYGMVKLIDADQGRISTSSGQIIKFSQEDS